MFGIVTAFFASTAITSAGVWIRVTNLALDDEHKFQVGNDTRSTAGQYLGGLGFIFGGIFGALCAAVVSVANIIRNGRLSMLRGLHTGLNLSLAIDNQYEIAPDARTNLKIIFGMPSYCIGLCLGGIASFFMGTAITSARTFKVVTNLILAPQDEFALSEDKRCNAGKAVGGLGLAFGSVAGIFGAFGVACGRIITNTYKSFLLFFKAGLNLGIPADSLFNTEDDRSPVSHTFGSVGLVTGFISGFATAILASSGITTARTFMQITNLTLDHDDEMTLQDDKRFLFGKILGAPGFIPGTIAGIIGAVVVGLARIISNTFITSCRFAAIVSNFGLPPQQRFEIDQDELRSFTAKIIGGLGIPIGSLIGFIGAVFVSSLQTIWQTVARMFLFPWQLDQDYVSPDNRFIAGKLLGIPGYALGIPLGFAGMLISTAVRVAFLSYITGVTAFTDITNIALPYDMRNDLERFPFTRGDKIFGIPGYILGGIAGLIGATVIYALRFLSQTLKSWAALSGSFLNCGLGWRLFDGLSADRRPHMKKIIGGLGYGLALVTTLPLAAFIFVARQVPTVVSVALGVLVSPAIVLYRGFANALNYYSGYDKFDEPAQEGELIIENQFAMLQGFKNIYSSLNAWGGLEPGAAVAQNADGQKNRWTFFRKSLTFNTNSPTERTLDKLLAAYKAFALEDQSEGGYGKDFPASEAFNKVIDKVKEYYANGCFDSAREIKQLHIEIDNIAKFVRTYLQDRIVNPDNEAPYIIADDIAPPPAIPFAILFFGDNRQVAPDDEPGAAEDLQPGMAANDAVIGPVPANNRPEGMPMDERSLGLGF